ncbi:DTW domain-containing protein [Alishewanella longhuensis]
MPACYRKPIVSAPLNPNRWPTPLFALLCIPASVTNPTGRLICEVAADNHAFVWDRTQPDPQMLALLANPTYAPIVVFPEQYAAPERCLSHADALAAATADRIPLFVMLDGTWREAKKMFRSPYLATLPVLGIQPEQASDYLLREAAHLHQLCTAEVAISVLEMAQEPEAAAALATYFRAFRQAYLKGKPHLAEPKR